MCHCQDDKRTKRKSEAQANAFAEPQSSNKGKQPAGLIFVLEEGIYATLGEISPEIC